MLVQGIGTGNQERLGLLLGGGGRQRGRPRDCAGGPLQTDADRTPVVEGLASASGSTGPMTQGELSNESEPSRRAVQVTDRRTRTPT